MWYTESASHELFPFRCNLSYASGQIKGKTRSASEMITYAVKLPTVGMKLFSNRVNEGGLTENETEEIINHFFEVTPFTTFKEAIDDGHPVFSYFQLSSTEGHAVIVIGYDPNSQTVIYMDPETGTTLRCPEDSFSSKKYVLIKNK